MIRDKKIKVLIVDDSLLFRELLSREISKDGGIEVVGTAADSYIARDKILELNPHVLILDVEMPRMNGIEFLKKLMPQYPVPVVVISAQSDNVFDALNAGAVDFVNKPKANPGKENNFELQLSSFIQELVVKVKIASVAKVGSFKKENISNFIYKDKKQYSDDTVIAIGASTGGTEAVYDIIKALPKDMPGIVATLHMPPVFTKMYADRLNNSCSLLVKEAEPGDTVTSGKVLIAPGDYHLKIVRGCGGYKVDCVSSDKVNGHRPSVDVLFNSVADIVGKNSIGVILTGMGSDGAQGLLNMRNKGAITIGQDEKTSVVYGMPKVAYEIGGVMKQAPLWEIPDVIFSSISKDKK